MMLLEAQGLSRRYGGIAAVDGVDFSLRDGEVRAIIGPNGAGKTTLAGMICGRIVATAGTIRFRGADIARISAPARVLRGIVYTFQVTSIYRNLTCFDNVALAAQRRVSGAGRIAGTVDLALRRVGLGGDAARLAGVLPYGHQRLLEVAMALALEPKLLIMDEPTQGLAPSEIVSFCGLVRDVAKSATVLIIEHNLKVVLELAGMITVMDGGRIIAEGTPSEIEAHASVQRAYLGA